MSASAKFGNANKAIQYFANGDSADWLYAERSKK